MTLKLVSTVLIGGRYHKTGRFECWHVYCSRKPIDSASNHVVIYKIFFDQFLPARRYASAGYSDRNVSVRHAPVLCQNEES